MIEEQMKEDRMDRPVVARGVIKAGDRMHG
jgi:hypothetical protein